MISSFAIGSVPIDKLFHTLWESEQFAKTQRGLAGDAAREDVGLLESLTSPTGILHDVHVSLAEPLFALDSPLRLLLKLADANATSPDRGIRVCRAMQIRLSASFRARVKGIWWERPWTMVQVLCEARDAQLVRVRTLVETDPFCRKCQGRFLIMLRTRLVAAPVLTLDEQLTVVLEIFTSLANDPLIASIHELEGLHASSRALLARSMCRRKRMPVSVFATQALIRWKGVHTHP